MSAEQLKGRHTVTKDWVGTATFSPCKRYRYTLTRKWGSWSEGKPLVCFCGLNPSTADEMKDDATLRREIAFAKAWGFEALVKVNAYAFRSTNPKGLWTVDDPYGPDNIATIGEWSRKASLFIACWGNNIRPDQAWKLRPLFDVNSVKAHALRLTKEGQPEHTLRLPKTLRPRQWQEVRAGFGVSGQLGQEWQP